MLTYQIAQCCKTLQTWQQSGPQQRNSRDRRQTAISPRTAQDGNIGKRKGKNRTAHPESRLPARKELKDFVYDEVKVPSGLTPAVLESGDFIANKENLILYGNVGTGKTHLAAALGLEACRKGRKVGFYRTAALVLNSQRQERRAC